MSDASVDLLLDVFATMSEMERMGAVVEAAASNGESRSAIRISFRIVAKLCSHFFSYSLIQHLFQRWVFRKDVRLIDFDFSHRL